MNIKPAIYEALTARQRIISMIDAISRKDEREIKRLNDTCEKKRYRMLDSLYSDTLERLFQMSMAVEADLRGMVIDYLDIENQELKIFYLQQISNTYFAWCKLLDDMGISKESMLIAASPRHHMIDFLLHILPKADKVVTNALHAEMKEYVNH